jgi:hypothetical protein
MNLQRKIEVATMAVTSISRHEDEDAAVRHAALDRLEALVKAEREAIDARVAERIAESFKG